MDWQIKTINTYDNSAAELAEYFSGMGARIEDIERAIQLSGANDEASVVEIGCGDGRDAAEIIPRVSSYLGVDPSVGLLEIARKRLPGAKFVKSDAVSFEYPTGIDIIYAFASLLHVDRSVMGHVLSKASRSIRSGGVFYISLKERDQYLQEVKQDKYGERMFYYYSIPIIKNLASDWFDIVYEDHQQIGPTAWFTVALKRH